MPGDHSSVKANAVCGVEEISCRVGSLGARKATWVTTWFILTVVSCHRGASYPCHRVSFLQIFTKEWENEEVVMVSLAVGKLTRSGPSLH